MKTCRKLIFSIVLAGMFGCELSSDESGILVFSHSSDFSQSQDSWEVDFTDFPVGSDSVYALKFAYTDRPANLGTNQKSMMLSGYNHGTYLFMFMKRKITNLSPNTDYTLVFDVELASNASKGAVGIIAPGENVILKAGASGTEPKRVIEDNQYTLNIDKGNQSANGETTVVLGNIAVSDDTKDYTLITRNNAVNAPFAARSNSKGEMWLIVGTDSGSQGATTVYYTKVNVVFSTSN